MHCDSTFRRAIKINPSWPRSQPQAYFFPKLQTKRNQAKASNEKFIWSDSSMNDLETDSILSWLPSFSTFPTFSFVNCYVFCWQTSKQREVVQEEDHPLSPWPSTDNKREENRRRKMNNSSFANHLTAVFSSKPVVPPVKKKRQMTNGMHSDNSFQRGQFEILKSQTLPHMVSCLQLVNHSRHGEMELHVHIANHLTLWCLKLLAKLTPGGIRQPADNYSCAASGVSVAKVCLLPSAIFHQRFTQPEPETKRPCSHLTRASSFADWESQL